MEQDPQVSKNINDFIADSNGEKMIHDLNEMAKNNTSTAAPAFAESETVDMNLYLKNLKKESAELLTQFIITPFDHPQHAVLDNKIKAYASKINTINKYLNTTQNKTEPVNPKVLSQLPTFQMATHAKVDTNKPIFDNIGAFIRRFEKVMDLNMVDKDIHWKQCLSFTMAADDVDLWFTGQLQPLNITWNQASKILEDTFSIKDRLITCTLDFFNITMLPKESVADFGLRFQNLAHLANWNDDKTAAMLCLRALPSVLQGNVLGSFHGDIAPDDMPTSASQVLKIANKVSTQKRSLDNAYDYSNTTKKQHSTKNHKYKFCSYHGAKSAHTTEQCNELKKQQQQPQQPQHNNHKTYTQPSNTSSPPINLCGYCKKTNWSPAHDKICDQKKQRFQNKTYVRSLQHPATHPADKAFDDIEQAMTDIQIQAYDDHMTGNTPKQYIKAMTNSSNNRFTFPLLLQNKQAMALLDTGADVSVISLQFLQRYNLFLNKKSSLPTTLHLVGKNNTINTHGQSIPILIEFNNKKKLHTFEILDLADGVDCYIGNDLFDYFGITISNLLYAWPNHDLRAKHDNHKIDDPPIPNDSPAGTPEERQLFLEKIKPFTELNRQIPVTSFCPLDISIVRLDTPTLTTERTNHRQYPIANSLVHVVDEAVAQWLKDGTITDAPVNTTWNSPITLAKKKDANGNITKYRPCLDPRHINKYIKDVVYPLPLIKDIFENMHGAKVFTTLDLKSAFHRFQIHPDHQHKTAFTHRRRQYMFRGAPFGIKTLSSVYQKTIDTIFRQLPFAQSFIDDVIIFSPDMQSHTEHVCIAIQKLTEANLILNPDKCFWAQTAVYLLGFCVTDKGYDLDPRKVCNVLEWPRPTSGKGMQSFLGVVNYLRHHIAGMSKLTAPLDRLRNANKITDQDWTATHEKHFQLIKTHLQKNTLLHYPDPNLPMHVSVDASSYGLGCSLHQTIDGKEQFIGYMARSLTPSERNYPTNRRELAGIIFALKKFHKYLWGRFFILYTDHRSLTYIHTQRVMSPIMINWLETILDYNFTIIHKPGDTNIFPDLLSRLATPFQEIEGDKQLTLYKNKNKKMNKPDETHIYIRSVQSMSEDYFTPPAEEHKSILQRLHNFGHFGAQAIIQAAHKEGIHWTNLSKDALETVKSCTSCHRYNIAKKGYNPLRPIYAYLPHDHLSIDMTGPFTVSLKGNTYLLVVVDVATRFTILRALPDKKSDTIIHALIQIFGDFGYPRVIQSDNGSEFKNQFFEKLHKTMGIDRRFSTPYFPSGNGLAEKYVQTAKYLLNKEIQGTRKDWDWYIPSIQLAMNHKISTRLQTAPFSLMFARRMNTPYVLTKEKDGNITKRHMTYDELVERLNYMADVVFPAIKEKTEEAINKQKNTFDRSHKIVNFPIGSYVVARLPTRANKLAPVYDGPFKVIHKTKNGNYLLQDMLGDPTPRNYTPSELKAISHDDSLMDNNYIVEDILDHRGTPRYREYYVRWKGYSKEHDQWIEAKNINAQDIIDNYWKSKENTTIQLTNNNIKNNYDINRKNDEKRKEKMEKVPSKQTRIQKRKTTEDHMSHKFHTATKRHKHNLRSRRA
jgi:transposase InsO family protein